MKKGFTLAEVLITLAIIGVVAAMTVPTLMTSTRGKEYEVGANKALSTINNAMQMRYAMEGVTFVDYFQNGGAYGGKQLRYLTDPPGNRPGEKPALQTVECTTDNYVCKLADGMIVGFCGSQNSIASGAYSVVTVDTNGEKGPTRTKLDHMKTGQNGFGCGGVGVGAGNSFDGSGPYVNNPPTVVTSNTAPDIVHFKFSVLDDSNNVVPLDQRTRNILATGNAMISQ